MNKLQNSLFKIFIEIFVFDKKKRARMKARHAKKYLQKYVDAAVKELPALQDKPASNDKIIWQYWHQCKENAPQLIQKCFESVKEYMPEYKQIILSYDNIKNYVELPKRYYDLLEAGKIPLALFSDILRLYLLSKYGGTWVDSTIYLTDKIPDDIMNSNFCVLQKNPETDAFEDKMSCFFIHSKCNSKHLEVLRRILDKYWSENDFPIHYFMFEHISTILSNITPELKAEWDSMPYYNAEITGELQKHLFDDYTQEGWNDFKQKTSIHKLSYKVIREETSGKSYYDWLCRLGIPVQQY